MKAYKRKALIEKAKKQEGIIAAIKRNLNFEGLKPYQIKNLNEKLQKEQGILKLINNQL